MTDFKKVFLDTAPFIYFLDEDPNFGEKTEQIFSALIHDEKYIVTSVISAEEYLVHPYRTSNDDKVNAFWNFVDDYYITLCPINKNIAVEAAKIRAEYRYIKTMDALQLAAAICNGCDLFLTNDRQLKQFEKISCVTVEEWS